MAVIVLTKIGKIQPKNTTAIFDLIPIPNHKINKGNNATLGVAYNAVINGSKISSNV